MKARTKFLLALISAAFLMSALLVFRVAGNPAGYLFLQLAAYLTWFFHSRVHERAVKRWHDSWVASNDKVLAALDAANQRQRKINENEWADLGKKLEAMSPGRGPVS